MIISPPHLIDGSRWAGLRVGLLGGSFNPPHEGHIHISIAALRSLGLDFIWWLVTPHNPLKDPGIIAPYEQRMVQCREFIKHPRVLVSDLEHRLGVNRSYDTLRKLKRHFPQTPFVWITGMDNALSFHRWHRWRDILRLAATAHIARPPAWSLVEKCPLRLMSSQCHIPVEKPIRACLAPQHTYWLLQKKMSPASSTRLRKELSL